MLAVLEKSKCESDEEIDQNGLKGDEAMLVKIIVVVVVVAVVAAAVISKKRKG